MTRSKCFRLITLILSLTSCQDAAAPLGPGNLADRSASISRATVKPTILTLFSEAEAIDSLVILYFTDKTKFRYYTFHTTADARHLSLFKENLRSEPVSSNDCVKDGTIYGYINGNVYTTIYFNLSDSCNNLRLFKDGKLYSFPITASFQSTLATLKTRALKP